MRLGISTLLLSAFLLASPGSADAQSCTIGVYTDEAGTIGQHDLIPLQVFNFHVVLHVESTVAGAAYALSFPGHVQNLGAYSYGPNGLGLNVPREGGNNVGLGECAIGFNSQAVLVASYSAFAHTSGGGWIFMLPNTDESPTYPVYADCADQLLECTGISDLVLFAASTERSSIGAVKGLYSD